jgi:predicted AAA+ superfamily ATPase
MGIVINIPRSLEQQIEAQLGKQNAILLYGTKGTGKTTIIEHLAAKYGDDTLLLQGEDMQIRKYYNAELLQIISKLQKEKRSSSLMKLRQYQR